MTKIDVWWIGARTTVQLRLARADTVRLAADMRERGWANTHPVLRVLDELAHTITEELANRKYGGGI